MFKLIRVGSSSVALVRRDQLQAVADGQTAERIARECLKAPGTTRIHELLTRRMALPFDHQDPARRLAQLIRSGQVVVVRAPDVSRRLDAPRSVPLSSLTDDPVLPEAPREAPTTSFELRVVDELGEPIEKVGVTMLVDGIRHDLQTDSQGAVKIDGATTSFATATLHSPTMEESLRERWSAARDGGAFEPGDPSTVVTYGRDMPSVGLENKAPHTIVVLPGISRARVVGAAFATNKAFLRPDALPRMQDVVALYERNGGAELLIVGHTDTSGEPHINDPLSLERARSVAAYLQDDVDAWLQRYDSGPSSQRWGDDEDALMLSTVLLHRGQTPGADGVRVFQQTRGLVVDGVIGPQTRRALVSEYMGVDATTLPSDITPIVHGCGENFPLADDGVELQVDPPDGQDDPTDRRVELFFFAPPLGTLPEPPGSNSGRGGVEYLEWVRRSRQVDDFIVGHQRVLAVSVTDADDGTPIEAASVAVALGNSGAPGSPTDSFGVRTFFNVVAGSHTVRVEKEGYQAFSESHHVAVDAPPTVIPVKLKAQAAVAFELRLVDPLGAEIVFPQDVSVVLSFEAGDELTATTDDRGIATVESLAAKLRKDRFSVRVELGAEHYLVVSPEGKSAMMGRNEALDAARQLHRIARLPPTMEVSSLERWVLDPFGFDDNVFVTATLVAKHTAADGSVGLLLMPAWQHIEFEYFDRFHRKFVSVPGTTEPDRPAFVLCGHEQDDFRSPDPTDVIAESAWPLERGEQTVHCLAWFPAEDRPLPDSTSMVRFTTEPRTFAVSPRLPGKRELEIFPATGDGAALVDEPSAERLRAYDVPEDWRSTRQFARLGSSQRDGKEDYRELVRQPTSVDTPLVFSLDDIVLVENISGTLRGRSLPSADNIFGQFAILDDRLNVYKPNVSRPDGIGEPYFTDRERLGGAERAGSGHLVDYPRFTRAVVFEEIYDVFDMRTPPGTFRPVGARAAVAKRDSSPMFHHEAEFQLEWPNDTGTRLELDTLKNGRCSTAVFRCCGRFGDGSERFAVLRWLRVFFDFDPSVDPPAGATKIKEVPSEEDMVRFSSQALVGAASRWNGTDDELPKMKPIVDEEGEGKGGPRPPEVESTDPVEIEVGDPVVARGRHVVLFQRGPQSLGHASIVVRLFDGVRPSMPRTVKPTSWDIADIDALAEGSLTAHELGHALALPDEYLERSDHASLGAHSISDGGRSPGSPYALDGRSMMNGNVEPRNRHFWPIAPWLADEAKMFTGQPMTIVRGVHRYTLPMTSQVAIPSYVPIARSPGSDGTTIGKQGLCDVFMYRAGNDGFTGGTILESSVENPYNAIVIVRLKLALSFSNPGFRLMKAVAARISSLLRTGVRADLLVGGEAFRARLFLSPRVIITTLPRPEEDPEAAGDIDKYLTKLSYFDGSSVLDLPSQQRLNEITGPPEEIESLRGQLASEYHDLVERIIEVEGVHCRVHVSDKGVSRILDGDSKPRSALLRAHGRQSDTGIALGTGFGAAADRVLGQLLGVGSSVRFAPNNRYRDLLETLRSDAGPVVVGRIRR